MVELMVALAVSLATLIALMASVRSSEGLNRAATGNADADQDATVGLNLMSGDIRQGGRGLATSTAITANGGIACSNYWDASGTFKTVMPVQIIQGSNNTDQIIVRFSDAPAGGVPAGLVLDAPSPSTTLQVQTPVQGNFKNGDLALLAIPGSGTSCTLVSVQSLAQSLTSTQVTIAPYPSTGALSFANNMTYGTSPQAYLINMGNFGNNQYQVMCNALVLTTPNTASTAPSCTPNPATFVNATVMATNIVALRAQYGIAPANSQIVNCWVNPTNGGNGCDGGNWAAPSAAQIARIKAVRIAIVARSPQPDPSHTEPDCANVSNNPNNHGPCLWPDTAAQPAPTIDFSSDPKWKQYRYRVFSTIVPLKNVLWANI